MTVALNHEDVRNRVVAIRWAMQQYNASYPASVLGAAPVVAVPSAAAPMGAAMTMSDPEPPPTPEPAQPEPPAEPPAEPTQPVDPPGDLEDAPAEPVIDVDQSAASSPADEGAAVRSGRSRKT